MEESALVLEPLEPGSEVGVEPLPFQSEAFSWAHGKTRTLGVQHSGQPQAQQEQ